jgi:hypothetical protein
MITATLTVDDYIAAHRLDRRRIRVTMYTIGVVVLAIGIGLYLTGVKWWPIALLGGAGGLIGQWWDDRLWLPSKVRKLYDQFKGISDPVTFSWDAVQIEGRGSDGEARRKWSDYLRLRENDEVFLLYITDQLWHVYPKRWFADPSQLEEFGRYARAIGET